MRPRSWATICAGVPMLYTSPMETLTWAETEIFLTGPLPPEAIEAITPHMERRARMALAIAYRGRTVTALTLDRIVPVALFEDNEPAAVRFFYRVVLE